MGRNTMRSSVNNEMRQRLFTEYLNEQKLITNDKLSFKKRNTMEKFTRKCSATGVGMNEGYVENEAYSIDECYWTEWYDEEDHQYEMIKGIN